MAFGSLALVAMPFNLENCFNNASFKFDKDRVDTYLRKLRNTSFVHVYSNFS